MRCAASSPCSARSPPIAGRSSKAACPPHSAAPTKAPCLPTKWCVSPSSCAKRAATKWASPIPSAMRIRRRSAISSCACATPSAAKPSPDFICTTLAAWDSRTSSPDSKSAWIRSTARWPESAVARSRRARPATSSPRIWCSCWSRWACTRASIFAKLLEARKILAAAVPTEELYGYVPAAGLPLGYHAREAGAR